MQQEQTHKKFHLKDIIVFENDEFIVLNKPSGMLSIPDRFNQELPSLKKLLKNQFGNIFVVHRLDRDTSGIILFAKNEDTHKFFSQAFENREVEKTYCGIVHGKMANKKGTISEPIAEHPALNGKMQIHRKGKSSVTHYEVLEELGNFSFVQFIIETGRTHQIRVHMQHLGHPVVCDEFYGTKDPILLSTLKKKFKLSKSEFEEKPILSRLALHAWKLKLKDEKGIEHQFEAPLEKDMKATLQQLRKINNSQGVENS